MGNCIDDYRAAIGLFHIRITGNRRPFKVNFPVYTYQEILLTNFRCTFLVVSLSLLQSLNPNIDIVFLLFVLQYILIIGNVEVDPSPELINHSSVSDNSISICNINIRSARNKLDFLNNFTDEFDIIAVTETHLHPNISNTDIEIDSFSKNIIRKDRNKAGGGLLIYFKDYISVIRKHELENHIDESIWVEIQGKGTRFLLCSTYRPEWTDADYWTRLNHAIGMGYQINQNIILTGDLKSDLFSSRNNKLIDTMNLFNLTNVIEKPTRITEHSSTLLDPIIISDSVHYSYSHVLKVPSDISDHDASIFFIECPKFQTRSFQREVWLYENFSSKLDTVDWNALLSDLEDVDEMCNTFTETFLRVARECIPTKMVTIRNSDRPWFNSELRREIRKRDRIRKIANKFNKQSDIDKYKKQRNKVNNLKKTAKEHFEQNLDTLMLENISNPKTYWKIMKMLIKSNKGCSNIPPLQNIIQDEGLDEVVYEDDEKCELLNKYFSFISSLEDANIPLPDIEHRTNNFLRDIVITTDEIVDIIKILNPNKASGPDIISHKMLKLCPEKIAVPLQIIFNKSLLQCKYPTSWKIAHVIAIFKKSDKSLPSNYRPISLISCVEK